VCVILGWVVDEVKFECEKLDIHFVVVVVVFVEFDGKLVALVDKRVDVEVVVVVNFESCGEVVLGAPFV
jgi:hypothetical protein